MKRLLALVACLGLMAGCGIDSGRVRIEGRPDSADQQGIDSAVRDKLSRPEGLTDPIELVRRFLSAPADDVNVRLQTVAGFITPGEYFMPKNEVHVVHVDERSYYQSSDAVGNITVEVSAHHIGVLDNVGRIEPSDRGAEKLKFTVVQRAGGAYLSTPPWGVLLMSDGALNSFFQPRPLYFWSNDGTQMIPDLRYVTLRQNVAGRAELLLQWLYAGPSPWLAPAVAELPAPTRPAGKRVSGEAALIVDLATAPGPEDDGRLAKQLTKTLLSPSASKLELRVAGIKQQDYERPADPTPEPSQRFGIVNGSVRRVAPSNTSAIPNTAPVTLPEELNKNLTAVAFARGEQSAVLVGQNGQVSLWQKQTGVTPFQLGGAPSGQPVWLDRAATSALILADNRLHHLSVKGAAAPVPLTEGISAFSVSPDKTRVALVQNGRLMMAALTRTGPNGLALSTPQAVPTRYGKDVHNVAFAGESTLVVAGAIGNEVTLVLTTIDGATQSDYRNDRMQGVRVIHMASAPPAAPLFEVTGTGSFEAQGGGRQQLAPVGAPASADQAAAKVSAPSFEG